MLRRIQLRTGTIGLAAVLLLAALLALAGCRAEDDRGGAAATTATTGGGGGADTWATIQPLLTGCGCHQSAPGSVNGEVAYRAGDYADLVNQDGKNSGGFDLRRYSIVKRYNADQSTLYLTAAGATGMPTGMTLATAQRLKDWIDAGAPQ